MIGDLQGSPEQPREHLGQWSLRGIRALRVSRIQSPIAAPFPVDESYLLVLSDIKEALARMPETQLFDLVVTSPPYNLGKAYESKKDLDTYLDWQKGVIQQIVPRLRDAASLCWQVGNFVQNGEIVPLDISLAPIFSDAGLKLRNRIIWQFGHGLHNQRRFSGRYEVVLWYTKSDDYTFDLDAVRVPSKYPGKRFYKGPRIGELSGNPLGKNPGDVWEDLEEAGDVWNIPNVKANHVERAGHPCQFPVGLIERLILALTSPGALVFDPFAGVGSAGVASAIHHRRFWGVDIMAQYIDVAESRLREALEGTAKYRPHDKPIYDATKSKLSVRPIDWG